LTNRNPPRRSKGGANRANARTHGHRINGNATVFAGAEDSRYLRTGAFAGGRPTAKRLRSLRFESAAKYRPWGYERGNYNEKCNCPVSELIVKHDDGRNYRYRNPPSKIYNIAEPRTYSKTRTFFTANIDGAIVPYICISFLLNKTGLASDYGTSVGVQSQLVRYFTFRE